MPRWILRILRFALIVLLGWALTLLPLISFSFWVIPTFAKGLTQPGSIPGTFSVPQNGDAQYNIPIDVPPGIRDVQPSLSLSYSSNQGNGRLGVGWDLTGLSSITRCKAVPIYDSYYGSINYNSADRFCLDGQRIINITGKNGEANSVYRTSIETWRTIKASADTCGNGPCSFSVTNSNGAVSYYGTSTDSRILATGLNDVRVWALKQVQDLNGNTIEFKYTTDPLSSGGFGQYYITRIDYTANATANISANRSVQFVYQTRPDVETLYQGGIGITTSYLLSHIQTFLGTQIVRDYRVAYTSSQASGRSEIQNIQVCLSATQSAACITPTSFSWQGSALLNYNKIPLSANIPNTPDQQLFPADTNNDGRGDLVSITSGGTGQNPLVRVYQSTGRDLNSCTNQTRLNNSSTMFQAGDVNGDGRLDLIQVVQQGTGSQQLLLYMGQTDGCTFQSVNTFNTSLTAKPTNVWAMDFNGDGRTDFVESSLSNRNITITPFASTGNSFSMVSPKSIPLGSDQASFQPMDINGDGMVDLVQTWTNGGGTTYQLTSYLSNGRDFNTSVTTTLAGTSKASYLPVDINGDGNVDLVQLSTQQSGALQLTPLTSNGVGGFVKGQALNTSFTGSLAVWPMDANGDGRTDLVQAYTATNGQFQLALYLNAGSTFGQGADLDVQLSANNFSTTYPIDLSGNGRMSVLQGYVNASNLYFSIYGTQQPSLDRISTITDGMGNQTSITYLPMSDANVYSPTATKPTYPLTLGLGYSYRQSPGQYPYQAVSGGTLQLVSQYTNTNTSGASASPYSYTYTLAYSGASMGLDGTGWLGFQSVRRLNKQSGELRIDAYNQTYPLTGTVASTQFFCTTTGVINPDPLCPTLNNRTILSGGSTQYQQAVTAKGYTSPYSSVYLLQASSVQYDTYTYGTYNYSRSETYHYDSYGQLTLLSNLGYVNQEGIDSSTSDNVYTCIDYYQFTDLPLLDYPTNIKVSSTTPCTDSTSFTNGTDLSLEKIAYTPQMQISSQSAWDSSNNVYLTTTYSYDAPGNLNQLIQPGGSTTQLSYDPTYDTYVDSMTLPPNASGVEMVSHFAFDPRFGDLVGFADPNNLVSTTCLDDFGRKVATQTPPPNFVTGTTNPSCLGTFTSSSTLFNSPTVVTVETQTVQANSTGLFLNVNQLQDWSTGTMRQFWDYYDGLGRNFQSVAQGLASTGNTVTCQIFDSGDHVTQQTIPYYIASQEDSSCVPTKSDTRNWLTFTFDVYGRTTQSIIPAGTSGNEQSVTTISYPNAPNTKTDTSVVTLAAGDTYAIQKTFNYQYFNSTRQLTQMSVPDATGAISRYSYDVLGRMISATDPPTSANREGVANTITYDSLNRRLTLNNPDQNTTSSGQATTWRYNPDTGLLASVTNAKGQIIAYTYDQLDRILTQNFADQYHLKFTYDDPAVAYSLGELTNVVKTDMSTNAPLYNYNYTFDAEGNRLTQTLDLTGYKTYTTGTQFDPLSRLTQLTYPDQSILQHTYQMGNLFQSKLQGIPYATYSNYTPLGSAQNILYGNGVTASYTFDPTGFVLDSQIQGPQQQSLLNQTVAWDHLFEVTGISDNLKLGVDYSQSFTHQFQRLTGAQADGLYGKLTFSYDASGNLIGQNDQTYDYSAHRIMTGGSGGTTSFSAGYDANGNTKTKENADELWTYSYDPENQMTAATLNGSTMLTVPVIDQDGQRLIKTDNQNITSVYPFPQYVITNYPNDSSVATKYLLSDGGGALGAVTTTLSGIPPANPGSGYPTPGILYFVSDYLDTTQLTTGADGSVVSRFAYMPYGGMISTGTTGPDNVRQKFQGKELDASTKLYNFDARYQDPMTGRFMTPDTQLASDLQRIDALNRFAFALNDPITNRDATGHGLSNSQIGELVGGLEIAAGVVVDIASGGTLTPVSAVLIGAGTSGLTYGAQENKHFSWKQYGTQEGIGAAMGLVTPGFGGTIEEGSARLAIQEGSTAGESGARGFSASAGAARSNGQRATGEIEMQELGDEGRSLENDELGGCSSFAAGTEVLTSEGEKPIEEVAVGDRVWAYNEKTGREGLYTVNRLFTRIAPKQVLINVGNEVIEATIEHEFYVDNKGWVEAQELSVGDQLVQYGNSKMMVTSLQPINRNVKVYNFEVDSAHTFYISKDKLLVHNATCNQLERKVFKNSTRVSGKLSRDGNTGQGASRASREYVNNPNTRAPSRITSEITYMSDNGVAKTRYITVSNPRIPGVKWDAGHLIGRQNGGIRDIRNLIPQNRNINRYKGSGNVLSTNSGKVRTSGRSWRDFEDKINRKINKYGERIINQQVILYY